MSAPPGWLPPMVSVDGTKEEIFARLYKIFERDFKAVTRTFRGMEVIWDSCVLPGDLYEEGFWHLVTKDYSTTKDRLFDPRRSERLPWCGPVISNENDPCMKVWDYREGSGRVRTYIWLEPFDYTVILERKKVKVTYLVTAFYVEGSSTKRSLQKKYKNRLS
jgi:hypothetical protein